MGVLWHILFGCIRRRAGGYGIQLASSCGSSSGRLVLELVNRPIQVSNLLSQLGKFIAEGLYLIVAVIWVDQFSRRVKMQMECRVSACASLPFILFLAALGWSSRKNTLDAAGNASLTIRAIDWNAFELLLFALVASQYHQHQLRTAYAGPKYDSTRALPMLYVNIPCYRGILSTFRPWSRVRTCAGC